jgi:hypothetical protein
MEDFYEFIKERIKITGRRESNCIGTALYIVGEYEFDLFLKRDIAKIKFSRMKKSLTPGLGYLVSWEDDRGPFHAAVIYKENPFEIVHRTEDNEILTPKKLNEFVDFIFKNTGLKPVYRIPPKLEKQLKDPQL